MARRPKSCANPTTQRLGQLESKYRALEEDYRRVLLEVRSRADQFVQQKEEIDRLTQATLREEKEIARLKQMLRLTEKRSLGVQTEEQEDNNNSWHKRVEVSTGESELTSETRCERERSSVRRSSQSKEKPAYRKTTAPYMAEKPRLAESRMQRTGGKERAPLTKKYKFIPTLNFRHN